MPAAISEDDQAWAHWINTTTATLQKKRLLRVLHPVAATSSAVQAQYCPVPRCAARRCESWSNAQVAVSAEILQPWQAEGDARNVSLSGSQDALLQLFSLNDYLGLSTHPKVCQAAAKAAWATGMGPRSSALVGGYTEAHAALEADLAVLKGTQACLLFPSGFAANQATIAALCSAPDCTIFSDELNHASIIDGARLAKASGAEVRVYRHNDLQHLATLLDKTPCGRRKLVVTDSLFSMDGDFADLKGLVALRRRHKFLLAIDEAHATLVCGQRGGGASEAAGVADEVDVHIGTLSKAFGAQGGFVACSAALRMLLLNRGRPYVFSTALPLPTVAAAHAALRVALAEPWRRRHLWALVARLGAALDVPVCSPIIPLIIGGEGAAVTASTALLRSGFHVPAIRPPTVLPGSSRLRVSLSAAHSTRDVDELAAAIKAAGIKFLPSQPPRGRL